MDIQALGRVFLVLGLGIAGLGVVLLVMSRLPILRDIGNLPGDIRFQSGGLTCIFPVVSMLLLSIVLTVVLNIVARLFLR